MAGVVPTTVEVQAGPTSRVGPQRRAGSRLPAHWPLTLLIVPFPLWWALGVDSFLPLVLVLPMAVQLFHRHRLIMPTGFVWWALFVLWVALGFTVLWSDAPGAVPGFESSRLLVFGFRLSWYVACTVVLLWVTNTERERLPDQYVLALVAWLFVVTTAGGILGVVAPTFEFSSAVETLLPKGLAGNPFVASLVHPAAADVQTVLGRPEPRPKAPFPFTNTWGSCLSITLVCFLSVRLRQRLMVRALLAAVALLALVPVAYSLNRGLWASLAVGFVGVLVLRFVRGNTLTAIGLVLAAIALGLAVLASPWGSLFTDRADNQHSNERREQLLELTTTSVTRGSPVLGFGSTRDVQGSFASISGAATADCPACGVPPLGTQGQLWLVLFAQGWPGLAFFLLFLLRWLALTWRCRTTVQQVCAFVVAFLLIQLPIYDTLGLPLYLVMIIIGLAARERHLQSPPQGVGRTQIVRHRPSPATVVAWTLVGVTAGGGIGAAVAQTRADPGFTGTVSILIDPVPLYLDRGGRPTLRSTTTPTERPRDVTTDTEAALLSSHRALSRASVRSGVPESTLRRSVAVTAAPSTRILQLHVTVQDADVAERAAEAVANSYLTERRTFVAHRRDTLLAGLNNELDEIDPRWMRLEPTRVFLIGEINKLLTADTTPGEIVSRSSARPVRRQDEVIISSFAALGMLLGFAITTLRRPRRGQARR